SRAWFSSAVLFPLRPRWCTSQASLYGRPRSTWSGYRQVVTSLPQPEDYGKLRTMPAEENQDSYMDWRKAMASAQSVGRQPGSYRSPARPRSHRPAAQKVRCKIDNWRRRKMKSSSVSSTDLRDSSTQSPRRFTLSGGFFTSRKKRRLQEVP